MASLMAALAKTTVTGVLHKHRQRAFLRLARFRALMLALQLFLAASSSVLAARLPANLKKCARTDPKFQECLHEAIQDALPKLKKGIPALGTPPIDPAFIDNIFVEQGSRSLHIKFTFINVTITGLSTGNITKSEFDLEGAHRAHLEYQVPLVGVTGSYIVEGRFLIVPLFARGTVDMKFWNPSMEQDLDGTLEERVNGRRYWRFTHSAVNVTLGERNYIKYQNEVNNDTRIADAMNKLVNDNVQLITDESMPAISDTVETLFKQYTDTIFNMVPFDEVFPEKL